MFDSKPEWPSFPSFINLYVNNGDELYEQAIKAGAISMTKMTTQAWGDRSGRIIDPFGNIWWIISLIEDVDPEEMEKRLNQKNISRQWIMPKKVLIRFCQ
jgi:PhnB protein